MEVEKVLVEEIECVVKNSSKENTTRFYQSSLRSEIDKYISIDNMTDKKRGYIDVLEINIKVAPFVLGWLHKPDCPDEYSVIKGLMTIEELNSRKNGTDKNKKKSSTKKSRKK